jgi:subfamily B ATP-binding cassette protein MsbA
MKVVDRPLRDANNITTIETRALLGRQKFATPLTEIWKLVRPRCWQFAGCLLLILINRLCSFSVPISSRYLINNVMYQHQVAKLPQIIGVVVCATLIQSATTYVLSKYLSITGQRVIAELRMQVQEHIGLKPITFYEPYRNPDSPNHDRCGRSS